MSHVPIPDSAGAGRGRGAHMNQPAWMTKQEQTSAHDGPIVMLGNIGMTANSFAAMAGASSNHYPSASSGSRTNLPSSSLKGGLPVQVGHTHNVSSLGLVLSENHNGCTYQDQGKGKGGLPVQVGHSQCVFTWLSPLGQS